MALLRCYDGARLRLKLELRQIRSDKLAALNTSL